MKSTFRSEGNQLCANKAQPPKILGQKTFLNSLYTSSAGQSLNILFIVYVSEKYANIAKETTKRHVLTKKDIFFLLVLSENSLQSSHYCYLSITKCENLPAKDVSCFVTRQTMQPNLKDKISIQIISTKLCRYIIFLSC